MITMDAVLALIRSHPGAAVGSGATDAEIRGAERALGLVFPSSVRHYLAQVGLLSIGSHELFGLGGGLAPHLDLVSTTISEHTEMEPPLPTHLLALENDGGGNHYRVDTRSSTGPIVFFDHELPADQVPDAVAPTLEAWFHELLKRADE